MLYNYCTVVIASLPEFVDVSETRGVLTLCATMSSTGRVTRSFDLMFNTIENTGAK